MKDDKGDKSKILKNTVSKITIPDKAPATDQYLFINTNQQLG